MGESAAPGQAVTGGGDGTSLVVRLHQVRVPLVEPLITARGEVRERTSILVQRIAGDGVQGWGECVVLDGLDYPLATLEVAWAWLCAGPATWSLDEAMAGAPAVQGVPRNALGALLDATCDEVLRRDGRSLATWLGGADAAPRSRVASAGVLGIAPDVATLLARAQAAVSSGHHHLVCKVRPDWDLEPLRALRAALPDIGLAADANGSYGPDDPSLQQIDALGLSWLEQPVAPADLAGSAAVAASLSTPVVLDESVVTMEDLDRAIDAGAIDGLNVKPGRVGGAVAAQRLAAAAAEAGLSVLVGGLLETGIGRAAALAVAASPAVVLPTDLGPSARYLDPDLTDPFVLDAHGMLAVPDGPGIGVVPHLDRVAARTVRTAEVVVRP